LKIENVYEHLKTTQNILSSIENYKINIIWCKFQGSTVILFWILLQNKKTAEKLGEYILMQKLKSYLTFQ